MNLSSSGKSWQTKKSVNAKMIVNAQRIMYNKCKIKKEKVKIRKITEASKTKWKKNIKYLWMGKKRKSKRKKEKKSFLYSFY